MAKIRQSGMIGAMGGRVGNLVFVREAGGGMVVRERPRANDPSTPPQVERRTAFARAVAQWRDLSDAEFAAWDDYAASLVETQASPSLVTERSAYHVFVGLAIKFLQVSPQGTIPRTPPSAEFYGDGISVTADATSGGVSFASDAANSPGVRTELLLQRLPSRGCRPKSGKYRTQSFITFTSAQPNAFVPCSPGSYAVAVRFVRVATGQASPLVVLGRVSV